MGMTIYAIIYAMLMAVLHGKHIPIDKKAIIIVFLLFVGMSVMLQQISTTIHITNFIISITLLAVYFLAHNPGDIIDAKTKAFNRAMFNDAIFTRLQSKKNFYIIILALDDFKFVNKTFGIEVGDVMLMQVAHYLSSHYKKGRVYRFGTDQFCLEISEVTKNISQILQDISERFRHPWMTGEVSVMLSTTISSIFCPDDASTLEEVVDVIDYSVITAKKKGKGSIVSVKDVDLFTLRKEKAIEKAIKLAIDRDTFKVYYQPIYNTEQGKFTSAEALVRLEDEHLGKISPDVFIPIAERNGSIIKLGNLIFERVCKFISENNLKETSIEYIEVNVSVIQCMQESFVSDYLNIMKKYGVTPDQINLEITETSAASSLNVFQDNIEKLHEKGLAFSLDDYGTGYSTLGYIHQFPFEIIKLDKMMIWDAFENERARITLKYTVGMLKELKVLIVAEGVETLEQQKHLEKIGCNYLQGWYYSTALPEIEFIEFIRNAQI